MKNPQEEIDLIYVLRSIKNGLSNLVSWIITTTAKKFLFLLLCISIGLGIGFLMFSFKKPVYVSDLTIAHTRFDNDQCFELINNLTKLNEMPQQVSNVLKTSLAVSNEIKSISYIPISPRTTKLYLDSANVMLPFKVVVEVYNPSVFDTIESRLMNYLETNAYGVKRKILEKEYLTQYEKRIDHEILGVDTLKNIVNESIKHKNLGNGIMIDEPIDPVRISQRAVELYNAKLKIKERQELNNSFEVVVGFNGGVLKTANMVLSMAYGFIISYLLGLIFVYRQSKKSN